VNELFISYSRRDKVFVKKFIKALNENGYPPDVVWVDWEDIRPSVDWEDEIHKGIEGANSIIFILSPEWVASKECDKEFEYAKKFNKRMFPVVWEDVNPKKVQPELASLNWIFFRKTDKFKSALTKLLEALNTDVEWTKQHTHLLNRSIEWDTKERDGGYLLRGGELQEAETWLSQASDEKQPHPNTLQSEYIFTSRQDDVRRQRRNLILVSTALVVSVFLAIAAVISQISALRQSQKALASHLAAQASTLVDTQPDLALLLSLESNYIGDEMGESDPAWLGSLVTTLNSSPKLGTFLHAHQNDVRAAAFSPDGKWLATGGGIPDTDSAEVFLWDLKSNKATPPYQKLSTGNTKRILAVKFSPNGKSLVAAGDGKTLFVWDPQKCCEPIHAWPVTDKVRALTFVKVNGQEYVAAATGNQITFWDINNGKMQDALTLHVPASTDKIRALSLVFSSQTSELAAGSEEGTVTVWDLKTREMIFQVCSYGDGATDCVFDENETKEIRGLAFNADGSLLVSGSSDQLARLWDAQTGDMLAISADRNEGGHINTITSVAFNPKNGQVATVSWDNTVRLWELIHDGDAWAFHRIDTLAGHSNSIWATAFSPDGKSLVSASSDKTVILWKVNQINQIGTPIAQMAGQVWALAAAPNGKQFAAGDDAGNIRIWNFDGKKLSEPIKLVHPEGVLALAYSNDNKWLASAGYDKTIRIWDAQTGEPLWEIKDAHDDQIWSLAFSPNGKWLASASFDKTVKLWDTSTHQLISKPLPHPKQMFALAFNQDGTQLLTAGYDFNIYRWDLTNPASIPAPSLLTGHIYTVNSLTYNPAYPHLLASTSDDKTLLVWDVDRKESSPPVLGLNESMEAVTFSPNGEWLASATNNNTVLLWQLDAQRCSETWNKNTCQPKRLGTPLVGHTAPVENVVFLSDTAMVSSSEDGQLILWNLDKSFWYQHACDIVNRKFLPQERSQYIEGRIKESLLKTVAWFSNLFGSEPVEAAPSCISK